MMRTRVDAFVSNLQSPLNCIFSWIEGFARRRAVTGKGRTCSPLRLPARPTAARLSVGTDWARALMAGEPSHPPLGDG
jgi:hypothetical protein